MDNVTPLVAFGAGLISFLSPCVLPMVPVYLATLCGPALMQSGTGKSRLAVFLHSLVFVAGFSLVFVSLGAIAGLTGFAIKPNPLLLNKISGGLLLALGVFMLAALKIPWLNYEKRFSASVTGTTGYLRSFIIGAVFSLGWTACVGPILGGILALALNSATAWTGAYMLAIFSLGLGLPFLIIGIAFDSVKPVLKSIQRYSFVIYLIGSLLLILMGILVLTNQLTWIYTLGV